MIGIEFQNAGFSYDGQRRALDDVSLAIEQGSFVCVLGGNGSGKSTLAKHVNALLLPDEGCVSVLGRDTTEPENVFFVRSHAGMVFQNPDDQIVASVIENDVAFGPENLGVPADELRTRVESALAQVGLQGFGKKQTETLSGGQKQRVAVAGALAMGPDILVLDEASAMLDPRGRAGLLRVCHELNDAGMTIVLITHYMEEATHADRVIVLEGGKVALDGAPHEVFLQAEKLAQLALDVPFAASLSRELRARAVPVDMHVDEDALESELVALFADGGGGALDAYAEGAPEMGADSDALPIEDFVSVPVAMDPALDFGAVVLAADAMVPTLDNDPEGPSLSAIEPATAAKILIPSEPALIEFKNVSFTYEAVSRKRHRHLSIARGKKQADWGRFPSEHWALRELSFSIHTGEFFGIAGHTGSGKSTLIQLTNGLLKPTEGEVRIGGRSLSDKGVAVEARRDVGVVFQYPERQLFAASVFDDVAFGPRNLGLSADQVEASVREAMSCVHLDLDELRDRSPFGLSGGQQRRVAFAGVLAMHPRALVLDEPVAGLDPQAKRQFLKLLKELHDDRGLTVVVVSHNMDDLAELCDRVLVLNEGRLFALDEPARIFADEQALKNIGLGVPHGAHLVNCLARDGVSLAVGALPTAEQLAEAVASKLAGKR